MEYFSSSSSYRLWIFTLIFLALYANFKDDKVSFREDSDKEQLTMIEVIKFPVRESFNNLVNFESLNGI